MFSTNDLVNDLIYGDTHTYPDGDTGWPSGTVYGKWNPIPMGMYADMIIRQMGATPAQIQAHIDRVIGREVEKDIPFIFIPNANAPGQSGGYFYDKQTGQIHTEEQWGQKGSVYTELAKGNITQDQAKEQISGVPDALGNIWSPTGDNTNPVNIEDVDTDLDLDLMEDTTDTLEDVYEQPENIDVDIPVDNTPPVVEVEPEVEEPVITQPVEEEETQTESGGGSSEQEEETVENTEEQEEEEEIYLEEGQENPDNVPWWIVVGREDNGDLIIKPNPDMRPPDLTDEEFEKHLDRIIIIPKEDEWKIYEPGSDIGGGQTEETTNPVVPIIDTTNTTDTTETTDTTDTTETTDTTGEDTEGVDEESTGGEGEGTEEGEGSGENDGSGDGLGAEGLFGNLGGKGAKDPLGKFEPVSIVNPVAPVSAAEMYRRPQYITKSLFSEYFK